ncbi:MAG: glycosyltransferase family 4 protein [Candidatus Korarchaeum sp.]
MSHEYPPYAFGGVAYYTKELAEYLSRRGYTIYIVAGRSKKYSIETHGEIVIYRAYFPDIPVRSVWYSIFSRNIVLKLVKWADTIIFNSGSIGLLPNFLSRGRGRKEVISVFHGTVYSLISYYRYISLKNRLKYLNLFDLFYHNMVPLYLYLGRQEVRVSDKVVAVAHHVIEELTSLFPELRRDFSKLHTAYGGVDFKYLTRIYETHGLSGKRYEKPVYAYVGRLYTSKGVNYAVEAFRKVQELLKGAELWIFGKGPLEGWVRGYARKHGLSVRTIGFVPRDALMKLLAARISVLLLPSLYEGCPYVLLEANALGIPVVAWDLPWSREFVLQGVNGYLAQPFSLESLAESAVRSLSLRGSERVREIASNYDKGRSFMNFERILEG